MRSYTLTILQVKWMERIRDPTKCRTLYGVDAKEIFDGMCDI